MEAKFRQFDELFEKAQKVLLVSHKKPDGDTLGASSALYQLCLQRGKQVTMACVDSASECYNFMLGVEEIMHEFNFKEYDLIVVSDAGARYMTSYEEKYPEIFSGDIPVVNIDHHISNDNFGTLNIVDTQSASTTVVLFKMFKNLGYEITAGVATSLMAGIYNDTGSFMHSNTNSDVYDVASQLLAFGAEISVIVASMFNRSPVSTLKLWGRVLDNIRVTSDGVAMSVVTKEDFDQLQAQPDQLSGIIEYLNAIPDARFSLLLSEDGKGNVKGSMRTQRTDLDLSKIASTLGGGGHAMASGFSLPGEIKRECHYKIVSDGFDLKNDKSVITDDLMIESAQPGN